MGQSKTFTRSIIEYFVSYKSIKVYLIIRVKEGVIIPRDKLYGKVSKVLHLGELDSIFNLKYINKAILEDQSMVRLTFTHQIFQSM